VNGFFRSGTSAVWGNLKNSNDEALVFYEPCHPQLIKLSSDSEVVDELHGMKLWLEYASLQKELLSSHPYISGSAYGVRLKEYVELFEEYSLNEGKNLILQSNRWHFELLNFVRNDYMVIHIIRSPGDVFMSMKKVYERSDNLMLKKVNRGLLDYYSDGFWEFGFLVKYLSGIYSNQYLNMSRVKSNLLLNLEEKFVLIWVLINFNVIRMLQNEFDAQVVSYRQLGDDEFCVGLFKKAGMKWDTSYFRSSELNLKELEFYRVIARRIGVLDEYDEVVSFL